MTQPANTIQVVSRRTGLSVHVIRVWQKRYGAVTPARTATNRRVYSEDQIKRLRLLRDLTQAGHSIGQIANLPQEILEKMVAAAASRPTADADRPPAPPSFLEEALAAVKAFDGQSLEKLLERAETTLGGLGLLQTVVAPLAQNIGALWRGGELTAAHEHFASAVIRAYLAHAAKPYGGSTSAPTLVVATPAGQLHEVGAMVVSAAAVYFGWRVTYLGASLPAAEIAGAARQCQARAVALSLVYPEDDPRLGDELIRLRGLLPAETSLLIGGRALPAYRSVLKKVGAVTVGDLTQFGKTLDDLRRAAPAGRPA
jgi:DNA-binding transcriptional MerR regulator/methylmalonyl-CoA mutase cobalamin-binding subunit